MPPRFRATFPGTPVGVGAIRQQVAQVARECGFDERRVEDVKLAASEAASNAVVHAYRDGKAGEIRVSAEVVGNELVIVVADDGPGMVPRTDSPGLGLGLPVITTVSDRMEVVSEGDGTELHIAFGLAER
jgi:anti-sigma regulatory factor (Ser/Thr protein kinase)